jgi:hypothetical protein
MPQSDDILREVLPIPDRQPVRLTTYSAKDPDTKFPPIRGKGANDWRGGPIQAGDGATVSTL